MVIQIMYKQGWLRFEVFEKLPRDIHTIVRVGRPPRSPRQTPLRVHFKDIKLCFVYNVNGSINKYQWDTTSRLAQW